MYRIAKGYTSRVGQYVIECRERIRNAIHIQRCVRSSPKKRIKTYDEGRCISFSKENTRHLSKEIPFSYTLTSETKLNPRSRL